MCSILKVFWAIYVFLNSLIFFSCDGKVKYRPIIFVEDVLSTLEWMLLILLTKINKRKGSSNNIYICPMKRFLFKNLVLWLLSGWINFCFYMLPLQKNPFTWHFCYEYTVLVIFFCHDINVWLYNTTSCQNTSESCLFATTVIFWPLQCHQQLCCVYSVGFTNPTVKKIPQLSVDSFVFPIL